MCSSRASGADKHDRDDYHSPIIDDKTFIAVSKMVDK
jgi:hypothetical protein